MSDPINPVGAKAASAVEGVEGTQAVEGTFEAAATEGPAAVGGDPVEVAIAEVAQDIQAGRIPDEAAASDAVILRLVKLRFGHMTPAQQERLFMHVHELLTNDPNFQSRIRELIALAQPQP